MVVVNTVGSVDIVNVVFRRIKVKEFDMIFSKDPNNFYDIPVAEPHRVSSPYGPRVLQGKNQNHSGIDFVSNTGLKNVLAVADGVVTYDQDDYEHHLRWIDRKHSAGNMIIILHKIKGDYFYIRYLHLDKNNVSVGQEISKGVLVGTYSDVGYSFGAHLHLDCYDVRWKKIDPTFIWGSRLNNRR